MADSASGMRDLTLRQIEILRAIVIAGSVSGAARFLNVAQPGISRALKHLETSLGINLFVRQSGRLVPAPEARDVFTQLHAVHDKLADVNFSIDQLRRGRRVELAIGSVPSIAHVMVPRAIGALRARFPDIEIDIDILKIEEAADYLLLNKGDLVCLSDRIDNAAIELTPLAEGRLLCLVDRNHPLAERDSIGVGEIVNHPLIGIDPEDPHGRIMTRLFAEHGLAHQTPIRARFGTTVIALVKQRLGIAVVDNFTLDEIRIKDRDLVVLPIREDTSFQTYLANRRDSELSSFARYFVEQLSNSMRQATDNL